MMEQLDHWEQQTGTSMQLPMCEEFSLICKLLAQKGHRHIGKSYPLFSCLYRTALDDDLPAQGQHYCTPCAKYFVSANALGDHVKTKPHKRRCKALMGAKPHNQIDADWAAGMGAPDNGQSTGPTMEV